MSAQRPSWQDDAEQHPVREYITYIIGGILTLGLVGWILGMVLDRSWIIFVGAGLGAIFGVYIAWRHQVDRQRAQQNSNKS